MNSKKTIPLLVIATLMLSLLPSVMFARALSPPILDFDFGIAGDTIKVTGTNLEIPAGTTVNIYWDDSTIAWNGVKGLLNSTTAKANGNYEVWFDVPEAVNGAHYIWIKTTTGGITDVASALFTVNSAVKLTPNSGLPGDTIAVKATGLDGSSKINLAFNMVDLSTPTTNSIGTLTTTFKVPTGTAYGVYPVEVYNETVPLYAEADFTVGPVITISMTSGTVGSVVTITGRGFTPAEDIVQGDVTLDGIPCYITTDVPMTVDETGRIRLNVVIPQTDDTDTYTLAIDSAAGSAEADFEVTALAKVTVTPSFGPVASSITVHGVNYPKISGKTVYVELWDVSDVWVADIGTATTLSDGSFNKVFKVPAAAEGGYQIAAGNDDYNIGDTAGFKVGSMNLILSEDSGPTGMLVSISGNGFTHDGTWNATFGTETIIDSSTVSATGLLEGGEFQIPQLAVGTYTITVWDVDAEITLTTQFQITKTTTVTLSVPSAPNGFNVTLRGLGFSDQHDGDAVDFVLYNTTSTGALDFWWTIDVTDLPSGVGACATNSTGEFYGYWIVDDADILSKGNYKLNVTDASGDYMLTIPFAVGDTHIVAAPRKASFKVGETISFNLEHSFGNELNSYINVYNPSGALVWEGDYIAFVKTGLWYTAPYSGQTSRGNPMLLLEDAPLGTWSWKWIDDDTGDTIKSGTFTVAASDVSALAQQVTDLGKQVTALDGKVTQLNTNVGGFSTKLDSAAQTASQALTSANGAKTAADAATTAANNAKTAADAATSAANNAKTAADNAASSANGLTTLVYAAIGASLIAALAAIVGLMILSKKIA